MFVRLATLSTFALVSIAGPTLAQTDPTAMAHAVGANQLGVMEYCQGRGDIGADAVAAQRSAMARLPASTVSNDADEALGKQGTLESPNGSKTTLDSVASARGSTVSAMCKQLGSSAVQSAAIWKQNGMGSGGMAPGGMAMPQMPNGMTMPQMPDGTTMPKMPASPTVPPQ